MQILVKKGLVLATVLLIMATGCSKKNIAYSEFMGGYDLQKESSNFVHMKPGADFSSYDKVMIDYLVLFLDQGSDYRGIEAHELNEVAEAFHQAVIHRLPSSFSLVGKPGPGVLRIRSALTHVVFLKPELNSVTSVFSNKKALSVRSIPGNTHLALDKAFLELEFLDSVTQERLALAVEPCPDIDQAVRPRWDIVIETFDSLAKVVSQKLGSLKKP